MSTFESALPRLLVIAVVAVLGATDGARAAACTDSDAMPTDASRRAISRATLCLINAERRGHGLRPLRSSALLAAAARGHSGDMVRRRYFSHTAPGGSSVAQRVRHSGYLRSAKQWRLGENLGWGSGREATPCAMVRAWMNSPPHRHAILMDSYRDVGIGVAAGLPVPAAGSGATYTVEFGVRR